MKSTFLNITAEEYHADRVGLKVPTLNYSTAKVINAKSALHGWMEHPKGGGVKRKPKKQMDMGTILHAILLSKGAKAQIIQTVYGPKHKKAGQIVDDFKTDAAQAERDEAIANGLIPLLPKEYDEVIAAATTVTSQLADKNITLEGKAELPMVWESDGVACRGCPDHFDPAPIHEITELKFTDWPLTDSSLRRLIRQMSYDIQAATYTEGVHIITGEMPRFRWIFAEMNPPYQVRIARPSDLLLQLGRQKWERARNIWKTCLETGVWTGYGEDVEIDPDLWELREYEVSVYPPAEVIGDPEYAEPSDDPMWF